MDGHERRPAESDSAGGAAVVRAHDRHGPLHLLCGRGCAHFSSTALVLVLCSLLRHSVILVVRLLFHWLLARPFLCVYSAYKVPP